MSTTDRWGTDPEVAKIDAQDATAAREQRTADYEAREMDDRKAAAAYHPAEHAPVWPATPAESEALRAQWAHVSLPAGTMWPSGQPVVVNVQQPYQQPYVETPNRIVHGLLTVATGFLWAPVWIIAERRYRRRVRAAREQASRG